MDLSESSTPGVNILFVHNHPTSFVRQDLDCLRQRYRVSELHLSSRRVNFFSLWRQVQAHDLIFGWFASWHTFLPVLCARCLNKPSVLVVGGYDLANIPAAGTTIGYGHQRGGAKKWISRAAMRLAHTLITNSHYSRCEAMENAGVDRAKLHVIYHGVPDIAGALPTRARERMAITVGNVDRPNLWRKGLEPFVRAASLLPEVKFAVIGAWKDDAIDRLRSIATPNVEFTGWVDDATLLDYTLRASVYVQASRHEGFGMAVAEAMLAGCIPVVTRAGALPEVAGDCGVYSESTEPPQLARAIQSALAMPEAAREQARQRVLDRFPVSQREARLSGIVSQLTGRHAPPAAESLSSSVLT